MKKSFMSVAVMCSLLFSSVAQSSDLEKIMEEMGVQFNELKKAVVVNKSLDVEARTSSQKLNELLYLALPIEPNLEAITTDPAEKEKLLVLYRKIMSETLTAGYTAELGIVEADLTKTTDAITLLGEKRREAHALFRRRN